MGSMETSSNMPPLILLLLLLPPTSPTTAPGGPPPLEQSPLQERLVGPGTCYGGEYGGCQPLEQGGRCETQFCCCYWQDGGCYYVTCPEGTVFSGEVLWYCEECNTYHQPDP